jgi:pyruvate carboxylase subunit B
MAKYEVTIGGRLFLVSVGDDGACTVDDAPARIVATTSRQFRVHIGDRVYAVAAVQEGAGYHIAVGGEFLDASVESEKSRLLRMLAGQRGHGPRRLEVHAPMPALVVAVEVVPGETIHPGQGLVILEAMKMENEIRASHGGRVREICVAAGQAVEKGQLLLLMEES